MSEIDAMAKEDGAPAHILTSVEDGILAGITCHVVELADYFQESFILSPHPTSFLLLFKH